MRLIWSTPDLTVRDVAERLPKKRRRLAYTTVMTVMNRLCEKGLLVRKLAGRAYVYRPKVSKSQFVQDLTRKTVQRLLGEFGDAAVAHFVGEMKDLGPAEFDKLRRLVEEGR